MTDFYLCALSFMVGMVAARLLDRREDPRVSFLREHVCGVARDPQPVVNVFGELQDVEIQPKRAEWAAYQVADAEALWSAIESTKDGK